ncbi:M6 family metalloprotease domain-containing protein [Kangiella marina]|uniref:Peptidase n=1 Tax=Kangiella marina TaxID=1079178 RepID=A0ABP8IPH5_9GAMM
MNRLLLGVGFLAWSSGALAGKPYIEHEYQYLQPNGDVVTIYLNGHDYFGEQHSKTGVLVIYDETVGGLVYATVNEDRTALVSTGELVSSSDFDPFTNRYVRRGGLGSGEKEEGTEENKEEKLGEETSQQQITLKTREQKLKERAQFASGNVRGLTLLIEFPDETSELSQQHIENFLNAANYSEFGNSASVNGYFSDVSHGNLNYTNTVTRFYTAKNHKAYYTDDNHSSTVRSRELITEALTWLENTEGFDFSTLSTDANNQIMGLNVFYAGDTDGSWSRGLWPHMGKLIPAFCADGVCTDRYQITNIGSELELGPFVHETAHLLFRWPDLFDYDESSFGSVADFGLMALGGAKSDTKHNPVSPNAYFRYLAGWVEAQELNPDVNPESSQGQQSLSSDSRVIYRWSNPNRQGEAFYIETIHQSGHNQFQPDSGLAVWHIDPDGSNNNELLPFVQMEHADGNRDPENAMNQGDDTDLYAGSDFNYNIPQSGDGQTNSLWSDGTESGLHIHNVSLASAVMDFTVGQEEAGQAEPTASHYFSNYLYHNELRVEPHGGWFYTEGGTFTFTLEGPTNADFDLYLQEWNGNKWVYVAASQSYSSSESIQYATQHGYYRVIVHSYYGSGYYELRVY